MSKGKAIIPVKLEKISDLYMKHDYKEMELSDSVCAYIEEIAYMIPINTDIILEIHCPEIDDNEYDLSINNRRALIFTIVGLFLLIINILTEDLGRVFSDFLSVVWWVAIWDMVEILVLDNQDIKFKRLNNQQLYDSTIKFVFDEESEKTPEESSSEVKV